MPEEAVELSPTLLRKIDENRRGLTREEFIELCVDTWLKRERANGEKPSESPYVTREEFQEFERGIKNLLRSFLNFFLLYWMELSREETPRTRRLKDRLMSLMAE